MENRVILQVPSIVLITLALQPEGFITVCFISARNAKRINIACSFTIQLASVGAQLRIKYSTHPCSTTHSQPCATQPQLLHRLLQHHRIRPYFQHNTHACELYMTSPLCMSRNLGTASACGYGSACLTGIVSLEACPTLFHDIDLSPYPTMQKL